MFGYTMSFGDSLGHMISFFKKKKRRRGKRVGGEGKEKEGRRKEKQLQINPGSKSTGSLGHAQSLSTKLSSLTHKHSY